MTLILEAVLREMTGSEQLSVDNVLKLQKALFAWGQWYSKRLDAGSGFSGFEQDLFEAIGCVGAPEKPTDDIDSLVLSANEDCNICRGQTARLCSHETPWSTKK